MISIATIKQMVQHANKLTEFHVKSNESNENRFNESDYNEILSAVLFREPQLKLTMTFQFSKKDILPSAKRTEKLHDVLRIWNDCPELLFVSVFYQTKQKKLKRKTIKLRKKNLGMHSDNSE